MAQRITEVPDTYISSTWRKIITDIKTRFGKLEATVGPYTVSNYTETRTLDMGVATAADIGNFVATLVSDLQNAGRLSKG